MSAVVNADREPIDIVYTWVDGAYPGYPELLAKYSANEHDRNPNRYRDNLEIFKYSLRSLERFAPWVGTVHVVTCRPQVPEWMDLSAPNLRIVHHDAIFDPEDLPSFNSFGIVANLHRVPEVSDRFIYMEDDTLFGRSISPEDFVEPDGRIKVFVKRSVANDAGEFGDPGHSRWESALAFSNRLLDADYSHRRRGSTHHVPLFIDKASWRACAERWHAEFKQTTASRFRGRANVAPEYLYPWYLVHESLGRLVPRLERTRMVSYLGLDNHRVVQKLGLALLRLRRTPFCCLNDNFGDEADQRVEGWVREHLEFLYPDPSRYERSDRV